MDMIKENKDQEEVVPVSKTEMMIVEQDKKPVQTGFTLGVA